jgi:hypothetical protein
MLFNFDLVYIIRRVQVDQGGLKMNVKHHLPVYADGVNILSGSVHTMKENTNVLAVAGK